MAIGSTDNKNGVITAALNKLKRKGYKLEFRRETTCLYSFQLLEWIMPEDFTVDDYFYFEDLFNPDAERVLYAITLSRGLKGFLIDSCNVYMDNVSPAMAQKLKLNKIINRKNDLANAGKGMIPNLYNAALAF